MIFVHAWELTNIADEDMVGRPSVLEDHRG